MEQNYTTQDYATYPILALIPAFQHLDDWYLDLQETAIPASPVVVTELLEVE